MGSRHTAPIFVPTPEDGSSIGWAVKATGAFSGDASEFAAGNSGGVWAIARGANSAATTLAQRIRMLMQGLRAVRTRPTPAGSAGPPVPPLPVITVFFGWRRLPAVLILWGSAVIPARAQRALTR